MHVSAALGFCKLPVAYLNCAVNNNNENNTFYLKCFPLVSPVKDMQAYIEAGLTTFDMADIYGPAEEIFGHFNSQVHKYTHV